MDFKFVQIERHDRAGLIRINRPKALNALNRTVMQEIGEALDAFDQDDGIGAIVITGDERAFAAGADIKEMAEASAVEMLERDTISLWDRVQEVKKPVIAAVSGWCLG
ncbi:MAG TPA: enoyl-CoA hydratase, partial [Chloroflexi bacterium]|nr:enoyl-CoA hydratase [Chloroflexota bacterium]